uniref:Zinc finger, CCHC-type n=1 Tax=Tanacetum cinerariifolium TaxID=118510 RepID=A0A699ICG5_TANCI|nr:zinc finger, CCHC-type [Tanacetum cinerariifolium]
MVVVGIHDPKLKTLSERGIEYIFVGYAKHSKAFRIYVIEPNDSVSINSIIESSAAIFDENRFSLVPRPNLWIPNETEDIGGSVVPKEVAEEVDGTIENFKAKLVIQGFRQKSGIYYFDTYAPMARISTIRLLIAMTSIHNLIIHQMDVKTIFLNGELDEEVDLTNEFLSSRFSLKDTRKADVILGTEEIQLLCLHSNEHSYRHKYTSNPGTQHWQAIQRVLKYLKKTTDYRLTYTSYPSGLEGYTDSS